jgi:hypothetical protein
MCTVSFIPLADGIVITSNRDEKVVRRAALAPAAYLHQTGCITYPKDAQAGGTWFALHQNGNAAVLLNGAFEKHISQPPFKQSRGLVLLDIIDSEQPLHNFYHISLTGVEPFTLVLWQQELLYECRWDGNARHHVQKDNRSPHIWSSVTLYDAAVRKQRENWFMEWLEQFPQPLQAEVTGFHHFGGDGNTQNGLVINRDNILRTVSIASAMLTHHKATLQYSDLISNTRQCTEVLFNMLPVTKHA